MKTKKEKKIIVKDSNLSENFVTRMAQKERYTLPQSIWKKWNLEEYKNLRLAVLVFGGNTRNEAAINVFPEVSLHYKDNETVANIKGVMYLTTKRVVFLPKNQIPHPLLVQATFNCLRCLTGSRNDLSISISDNSGASANFKFPSTKALYQCFNLLRRLSDATRLDETAYQKDIFEIATMEPQETPFATIEFDFSEVQSENSPQISGPTKQTEEAGDEMRAEPIIEELAPIKQFLSDLDEIHFDIHFKLKVLFFLSLITFMLRFIPFMPLAAITVVFVQLYYSWISIKVDLPDEFAVIENPLKKWKGHKIEGYIRAKQFIRDWIMWDNPRKTMSLLESCAIIFISWAILPNKLYFLVISAGFLVYLFKFASKDIMRHIVTGFWFST